MNSTQSLRTCSMARVHAQFLPTQRSEAGRGPAGSTLNLAVDCGWRAAQATASSAVASVESSSTTNTCHSTQGGWPLSTLARQAPMLPASL